MPRLLRLSSLRIGLYVAVMAGLVMMDRTSLSASVLMALGLLVFLLALLGSQLKAHKLLTYGLMFLSVGIITLAFGDLQSSFAEPEAAVARIMRVAVRLLGVLLFGVTLYTLWRSEIEAT